MAALVEVPDLGGEATSVVAEWYQADGASVSPGEPLCRVECEFVAIEIEADEPGLLWHRKPAGSIERPGAVLGLILAPGEPLPPDGGPAPVPVAPVDFVAEPDEVLDGIAQQESETSEFAFDPVTEDVQQMDEELEELQTEAVLLPFPRKFEAAALAEWDMAPGDAIEFRTSLFDGEGTVIAGLAEPGGSIPGLPLWETEEQAAGPAVLPSGARERFERISAEATASAQVLTVSVAVDLAETAKLVTVCEREWRVQGVSLRPEDVVLRAIAVALDEAGMAGGTGAMVIAEAGSDTSSAVSAPAVKNLKQVATARAAGGDAPFERADWLLVSLAPLGMASATPRLENGRDIAFAMGAAGKAGSATITMAYDSGRWSEGSAGRLMARMKELLEAPYAMLV